MGTSHNELAAVGCPPGGGVVLGPQAPCSHPLISVVGRLEVQADAVGPGESWSDLLQVLSVECAPSQDLLNLRLRPFAACVPEEALDLQRASASFLGGVVIARGRS